MKRLLAFLVLTLLAALAAFIFVRHENPPRPPLGARLPLGTLALFHLPDLEKTRDDWRKTDLYALWQEPAVQLFMTKPRAKLPGAIEQIGRDSERLRPRDLFVAVTSTDPLRLLGGFEFRCSSTEAGEIMTAWEKRFFAGATRREEHRGRHRFVVLEQGNRTFATAIEDHTFYFGTEVTALAAILAGSTGQTLAGDPTYARVMQELPANSAATIYLRPEAMTALWKNVPSSNALGTPQPLNQSAGAAYSLVLDGAKLREVGFVAKEKEPSAASLTRASLPFVSGDAVLYFATLINYRRLAVPLGNKIGAPLPDDLAAALGNELSLSCEWPASARLPALVASLPVRDFSRAEAVVTGWADRFGWPRLERGGKVYYQPPQFSSLAAIEPMLAISDRFLVFGTERKRIETVLSANPIKNPLSGGSTYREAVRAIPDPDQQFAYIDLPNVYRRLDALARPILQVSAALAPGGVGSALDPGKLPPAEVVARHLTPIAASQTYLHDGYRMESIGSATFGQAIAGGLASGIALRIARTSPLSAPSSNPLPRTAAPSPSPLNTP